jgi:hypothetical protein
MNGKLHIAITSIAIAATLVGGLIETAPAWDDTVERARGGTPITPIAATSRAGDNDERYGIYLPALFEDEARRAPVLELPPQF